MKRGHCIGVALPLALVVTAVAFASTAFGETYTWDSANPATSLGGGAVTATLDGFSVSALSKNAEGNVRIEGDSMAFAAGAEVSLAPGDLTFALPVATAGAITFGTDANILVYDGQPLSGVSNIVVFAGKNLSDWTPQACDFDKNQWPGLNLILHGPGVPYYVNASNDVLDVQFQAFEGGWVKVVKVRFTQIGADIAARVLYARYISDVANLGRDFDSLEGAIDMKVAIDYVGTGTQGYDVDYIVMYPVVTSSSVVIKDALTASGVVTNGVDAALVFSGDKAGSAAGAVPCDFHVHNSLGFKNRKAGRFDISGNISGTFGATLSFLPWDLPGDAGVSVIPGDTLSHTGTVVSGDYQYINSSWETVAEIAGFNIQSITNVSGRIHGPSVARDDSPHVYFVSNSVDGLTRFYQFQTHDGWFKTMDVELNYTERYLRVRVPRAQYCAWDKVPGTGDEKFGYILTPDDAKTKGGNTIGLWAYCVHHVDVSFADHNEIFAVTSALTGTNTISGGVVDVEGAEGVKTCLVVSNAAALPPNGWLNVMSNGIVELSARSLNLNKGYQNGSCVMNVRKGGELRQKVATATFGAEAQRVNVDGGTVVMVDISGKDSSTYLQYLNMSDGGVVKGNSYPRVGYSWGCKWTSSGTATNVVECGMILVGKENGVEARLPLVCDAPLALNGEITSYGDVYGNQLTNLVMEKKGPSKVIQNGRNVMAAPVRIFEGAWVLGAAGLVKATKVFELRGGTLELADGVVQDLARLPLLTNGVSGVALGEGAALSLAEGGLTFVEGARLEVTGPAVMDMHRTGLRVGTTACLPDQTLSKIKYNDFAVRQDSEGYILAASHGTMILFK